jgi:DNA-binding transcriptional MerR regulator
MTKEKGIRKTDLAKTTGIRPSTIKFYSDLGILPYEQKEKGLSRRYDPDKATKRLSEIKKLKEKDLKITDIVKQYKRG